MTDAAPQKRSFKDRITHELTKKRNVPGTALAAGAAVGLTGVAVSMAAAVATPIMGLAAGGIVTWNAVTAAHMGTAAAVALTAAGALGGGIVGKIAAPVVAIGGMAASGVAGIATGTAANWTIKAGRKIKSLFQRAPEAAPNAAPEAPATQASAMSDCCSMKQDFDKNAQPPQQAPVQAPAPKHTPKPPTL